jgi:acetyl/propionyl-CoA carboxylase alpha subunit/acetyl-CoA carboxylase carboxyltransferase component
MRALLIANRGEIAIRIARAAAEMGIRTVAVHSEDDAQSLHTRNADEARALAGAGPAAYLDAERIIAVAREAGCDAVHPGYGFLSESADFARRCGAAGLVYVGPDPPTLALFGDKAAARALARENGVPVLRGTDCATSPDEARAFLAALEPAGAMMIKALAGGGGRGIRPVRTETEVAEAYERCRAEALLAFGNDELYVEELIPRPRHVEVQVIGDGAQVAALGERDCSLQRQRQKLVELAPAPGLSPQLRARLVEAALTLARAARLRSLATFEFLVDAGEEFVFIEANPRLQVEHTVTEAVTGVDLVQAQLALAGGATLDALGLAAGASSRGMAIELRINLETLRPDGSVHPAGGVLTAFEPPLGPGVRVDTYGYAGYRTNPRFDSLLAKLIVHVPGGDLAALAAKAYRALCEFRIAGAATNIPVLQALLQHEAFRAGRIDTGFIDEHLAALLAGGEHRRFFFDAPPPRRLAGARLESDDPLAVLHHGRTSREDHAAAQAIEAPADTIPVAAPMQGTIVSIVVSNGDAVRVGQQLLVMEAMKMEHVVAAPAAGILRQLTVAPGDTVFEGHALAWLEPAEVAADEATEAAAVDLDAIRPDLAESLARHAKTLDAARPEAVASRRRFGQRTARENIADFCDPGSFSEYGALTVAARRQRHTMQELIDRTPADGLVMGVARVNGDLFPDDRARCAVVSYDYTVLAGTQGKKNHEKTDRMFRLAERWKLPLVLFAEGGGGRPGDTDVVSAGSLHIDTFHRFARLSGAVPLIAIVSGRCFAGNAVLAGCCDVIIATANSSLGMAGPAMIEGGGLGVFRPEEVGPMRVQVPNGVVDIPVADEAEAVRVARQYLSYFQGAVPNWSCPDQRLLRRLVPENRVRAYDTRPVIETLADDGSFLELRRAFAPNLITGFIRIEGRPLGVMANNAMYVGGAIDSPAGDKAARFMQLCNAYEIPILSLVDTPGNMVGPEAEKTGLVRHCCRAFVVGANLRVPIFTVVLRKAYGLGAQAMSAGSFHASFLSVSWPTGEFGGMGLEGAVKLGQRDTLAAITDPAERKAAYERMVAEMYERGKAISTASLFEIDDVIDPAETRAWVMAGLRAQPPEPPREGKAQGWIDAW